MAAKIGVSIGTINAVVGAVFAAGTIVAGAAMWNKRIFINFKGKTVWQIFTAKSLMVMIVLKMVLIVQNFIGLVYFVVQ